MIRAPAVRTFTVFYSGQSDRGSPCCKNFIRIAADDAARRVGERLGVEIVIDADTEGVSGTLSFPKIGFSGMPKSAATV